MSKELERKVRLITGRCHVVSLHSEENKAQLAQIVREGATIDEVEYFEPAGFTSKPPANEGVEGLVVCRAGDNSQSILVTVGARQHRIPINDGESAIFNTPHGDFVKVRNDRVVHVKSSAGLLVEAPTAEFTGNVLVRGNLTVEGDTVLSGGVTSQGKDISDTHTHSSGGSGVPN